MENEINMNDDIKTLLSEEDPEPLTYLCPHCGGVCKVPSNIILGDLIQHKEQNNEE